MTLLRLISARSGLFGARAACLLPLVLLVMLIAVPAGAVQPDEVLSDPALEARARAISANLRCLVCQNQSIDDSDAPLARDLRLLVRERLKAGDTDKEIEEFVVARYGEFVLLQPRLARHTVILWFATPAVLLVALLAIFMAYRRRAAVAETPDLSQSERQRLKELLKDRGLS